VRVHLNAIICRAEFRPKPCDDRSVPSSDLHGWRFVRVGFEASDVTVGGVNPWSYKWQSTGDSIEVPHPSYPSQRHVLGIWTVDTGHGPTRFAAGELSNGVWCFYEPMADT
jgi:hypothetical protein